MNKRLLIPEKKITEDQIQAAVVEWFDLKYPKFAGRLFAVPNGGKRHIKTAVLMKKTGVRRGVPDLHLPVKSKNFSGLVIELKAKGGRPTPEQAEWLNFYSSQGFMAVLCVGVDAAISTLNDYMDGL